jgi:hypothetical protein
MINTDIEVTVADALVRTALLTTAQYWSNRHGDSTQL